MGYCDVAALVTLQTVGIRTTIPDPVKDRRLNKLSEEHRRALRSAQQTLTSKSGRWLMRHRGEFCERSFVHVLDYGGARRPTLRGRENILKRYLVPAACLNRSILLRETLGIGTLKQTWAASAAALTALLRLSHALFRCSSRQGDVYNVAVQINSHLRYSPPRDDNPHFLR
ncbi:MAG TPA: hypothetical protein VK636_04165 [Gemmatimonadaceae bacterium]|nr:hypothetical protein [Gemmatimonadaceae bacterium]